MRPERFARLRAVLDRRQPDLTLLMDRVNKAHNFSAILRNCDAVGVLEAHAVPPETGLDVHHHTSGGAAKWVRIHQHDRVEAAIAILRARGFRVVAAHPAPEAVPYRMVDFTRPTAVLVGAELWGVSPEALELADEWAAIPMMGMVRSLNVSVAAALLLMEALDQRKKAGMYESSRLPRAEYDRILFEWAHPRIAARCRARGESYPELGPDGEIAGSVPPELRG